MKVFSAIEWVDGVTRPRCAYGVEILVPGKEPSLYALSLDKIAIEEYLKVCQKATNPEHWRLVELNVGDR